jgi:hypothetical protein
MDLDWREFTRLRREGAQVLVAPASRRHFLNLYRTQKNGGETPALREGAHFLLR